jgi:hypothetical protein
MIYPSPYPSNHTHPLFYAFLKPFLTKPQSKTSPSIPPKSFLNYALTDASSERVRDLEAKSLRARENQRIRGAARFKVSALAGVGSCKQLVNSEAGKLDASPQRHSNAQQGILATILRGFLSAVRPPHLPPQQASRCNAHASLKQTGSKIVNKTTTKVQQVLRQMLAGRQQRDSSLMTS